MHFCSVVTCEPVLQKYWNHESSEEGAGVVLVLCNGFLHLGVLGERSNVKNPVNTAAFEPVFSTVCLSLNVAFVFKKIASPRDLL